MAERFSVQGPPRDRWKKTTTATDNADEEKKNNKYNFQIPLVHQSIIYVSDRFVYYYYYYYYYYILYCSSPLYDTRVCRSPVRVVRNIIKEY